MASECNFMDHTTHREMDKEGESDEHWRNSVTETGATGLSRVDLNFECSICLEFVQDPVVSLCGHLYCWPCIYKWIHVNSVDNEDSDHEPQCPVCKSPVSVASLVPLYGRGTSTNIISCQQEAPSCGLTKPPKPSAPIRREMSPFSFSQPFHHTYGGSYTASSVLRVGGAGSLQPIFEIFGEIFSSRIFRTSVTEGYHHSYSNNAAATQMPRARRQLMRADESLGRLCFFLFCCMIMCLLLF